ncbi:MAG: DUF2889 domain-containing protein [Desulfobacteraceae bacterium]|nr:MAG: DUF2889 domain-containing protein [Desulfobacteraceae bacterium]
MNRLKDLIKEAPVHERKVEFHTYPLKDGEVIVEGKLTDRRLMEGYRWDGLKRPPGVVHELTVRVRLGGRPLSILEAEAEMINIPHELCPTTLSSIEKIVGLPVVAGFTEEVRKRLGGIKGCTHLAYLIVAMAPAALHGFWTANSRTPSPVPKSLKEFPGLKQLTNSCTLWREGGPLIQEIEETLARVNRE